MGRRYVRVFNAVAKEELWNRWRFDKRIMALFGAGWTGAGVPADRVKALRNAFMALRDDAEFKADAARIGLDDPTPADEIEKFVKLSAAASPAVIGRLTAIINPHK